ncbi:replication associated protein [Apis mellifera virus-6]|nr:replication associated protein [Apis mellifera virus-6]QBX89270.1 replication associated protein [Apis mellifera virus-6]QBX89272.1 replication associated protein [Apis mellifera virus-6]
MAPLAPEAGNTKQLPTNRINASKRWSFTFFEENGSNGYNILEEELKKIGCDYILGKETCPNTGKKHIQGYVEFNSKIRPLENKTLKSLKIHWEKSNGDRQSNINYCSKEGNFFSTFFVKRPLIDPLKGKTLRPFQQKIVDLVNEFNDRKIYWFWDENGNTGKTSIAKHLCINYPNKILFVSGKSNDIKYAVKEFCSNPNNDLYMCIFYFTRTVEDFISYEAIESIKDGILFGGKYESGMCVFNNPQIICLANFEPNKDTLSLDRWNIVNIESKNK